MEEWNLSLELLSPSLPIAAAFVFFSLSVWDKYGWCVVAPLLLLTQRISFIYCRDYIAICCVFTTWLRVVIDMFATWGLDVCKWTFLFHVCVWKSDVSALIFHHHSRAAALQAQPAWLHRKIQIRPRKYGGVGAVRPAVSRRNRKFFGPCGSEHLKFCAFVGGSFRSCALHGVDRLIVGIMFLSAALLAAILHYSRRN